MTILVCGVNHKTADISIREKLSLSATQVPSVLAGLLNQVSVEEAVVLSTCNRTEIYAVCDNPESLSQVFLDSCDVSADAFKQSVYFFEGDKAVEHIMQVACGLDSMVLGEPQILGQMKAAVAIANEYQAIGQRFHGLFQHVFQLAKDVRTTTEIGACPVSVASLAIKLASKVFSDLKRVNVLLLGAGDTMRLVAKYLKAAGAKNIIVASRRIEKAASIAELSQGKAISIGQMTTYLPTADLVITATASELPILGKGSVESALKERGDKPMLMIDLAVPRDIEPEVKELDTVYLYTIDDLRSLAQENIKVREHAAVKARECIKKQASNYKTWLKEQSSSGMIKAFRQHVNEIRKEEMTKALRLLNQDVEPQVVLERLAYNLTNKLMHQPSVQMRQAGISGREDVFDLVKELFDIDL